MTRRKKTRKQAAQNPPAPVPRGPRRRRWPVVAVVLAALALAAWLGRGLLDRYPEPVVPKDPDRIGKEVLALVDAHVERVRENPGSAEAHGDLGLVYEANHIWDEATQSFLNAELLDPDEPLWPYHRASVMRENGDPDGALQLLEELAPQHPGFLALQERLGESLLKADRLDDAAAAFETVLKLAPRSPVGYVGLGEVRIRQGDHAEAARLLEQAVALDPSYKAAHFQLGLAYRGLGRHEDAKQELRRGQGGRRKLDRDALSDKLERFAVSIGAQLSAANRHAAAGRYQQAAEILEDVLQERPDSIEALVNLSSAYLRLGRPQEAMELLQRAEATGNAPFSVYVNLASGYLSMNRLEEAAIYARKAVELAPNDPRTHYALAVIEKLRSRWEVALESIQAAIRLDARSAKFQFEQGDMYWLLGRHQEALESYRKATELTPEWLEAGIRLAEVLLDMDRPDEARQAIAVLPAMDSQNPQLQERLQRLQERLGVSPDLE
jgi:tetratricopeptide (TPR) repeat protein